MADKKSDLRVVRTRNALRAAFEELIACLLYTSRCV